jgi:hypothetical protein
MRLTKKFYQLQLMFRKQPLETLSKIRKKRKTAIDNVVSIYIQI